MLLTEKFIEQLYFGFEEMNPNSPRVNITSNDNEMIFELNVAGYDKSDLNIKVEENQLIISTNSKEYKQTALYFEFKKKPFTRKFNLPKNANADTIKAKHENGILTVTIPLIVEQKKEKCVNID